MSKEVQLLAYGGFDNFRIVEKDKPAKPAPGQVLIKVMASAINFADLHARQGFYNGPNGTPRCPAVLGLEGAGLVTEIGEGVQDIQVGSRVIFLEMFGAWREYVTLPVEKCFLMHDNMTFQEGAALGVNYLTAYLMLFEFGNLRRGKKVLVHMAAGGVGWAVAQLCQTVPDVTVFGTASGHKHAIIKENGVTHPIDYHTVDYVTEIRKISPKGVDIVLDPLSGVDTKKGYSLLKPMGKLIVFGAANVMRGAKLSYPALASTWWNLPSFKPLNMLTQNKAVCGFHLGYMEDEVELVREAVRELFRMYGDGLIKPRIDSVWEFNKVGAAMKHITERKNIGKVILTWDDTTAKI